MALTDVVYGKGELILLAVAQSYRADPAGLFGPWLLGLCFDCFFMGLLCLQVHTYYTLFRKDHQWIQSLIGIVFILSCIKTLQSFLLIWAQNVIKFGDYKEVAEGTWYIWIEPTAAQLLSFAAESFFVYRCYRLTNRNWFILFGLLMAMTSVFVLTVFTSIRLKYDPYYLPLVRAYAIPALSISVAIDLFITLTVTYQLYRSKTGFRHETDDVLSRLLALTWESALPPTISALLNLIFYLAMQMNAVAMFFNILTPRLYVFSLMYTLNSRPAIRSGSRSGTSQHAESSDRRGTMVSGRHIRKSSRYLKSIPNGDGTNTIPVHVQTETVLHTTPADDYYNKKETQENVQLNQKRPVVTISKPINRSEPDAWSISSVDRDESKHEYEMFDVTKREEVV